MHRNVDGAGTASLQAELELSENSPSVLKIQNATKSSMGLANALNVYVGTGSFYTRVCLLTYL